MDARDATAFVVDGDAAFRRAVRRVLSACGVRVRDFGSGERFLAACEDDAAGCVLLELRLPGLSGLEVQQQLRERGIRTPVIFAVGSGGIAEASRAFRAGAIDVLEKPIPESLLVERVREALALDREARAQAATTEAARRAIGRLSQREIEVVECIVTGLANKQIARRLGIAERTVEFHRSNIMKKLGAACVADLIRIWLTYAEQPWT